MVLPFIILTLIWKQVKQICSKTVQQVWMKYTAQDGYMHEQSKYVATYFKVRFMLSEVEASCCNKSQYLRK